eukprot:COSAG02_NODE_7127_length_3168_cov_32.578690_1_plen_879_part_00
MMPQALMVVLMAALLGKAVETGSSATAAPSGDTTCGGALVNPVRAGGSGSDGWVPGSKAGKVGGQAPAKLRWDPSLVHNGSAGSLQVLGGTGTWTTSLDLSRSKGKLIRLSFFRHTSSSTNSLTVTAELNGVATNTVGSVGSVAVERRVAAVDTTWQLMTLGDFMVPVGANGNVSLSVTFGKQSHQNVSWVGASLNVASFSCEILQPNATVARSPLTKIASSQSPKVCSAWHAHSSARVYSNDVHQAAISQTRQHGRIEERGEIVAPIAQPAVYLYAGRNERVAFQVAVHGSCAVDATTGAWRWSGLAPPAPPCGYGNSGCNLDRTGSPRFSLPSSVMTVREVKNIELTIGTPPHGRLGNTPEYLVTSNDSVADQQQANVTDRNTAFETVRTFWFKLTVPADAPQGNMSTAVKLLLPDNSATGRTRAENSTEQDNVVSLILSFRVQLEVGPPAIAIPIQPSIDIYGNLWQHSGPIPPDEQTFAAYYGNLWDHRVFTGPDMTQLSVVLNQDDTVNVSSADYERELAYIVAHSPFKGDTVGSSGGQWLKIPGIHLPGHHGVAANATWLGLPIFTDETNARLTTRYEKASSSFLLQCFAILKRHGAGDRGLIKFFDEPTMDSPTVNALTAVANHIKAVAKTAGVRIRLRVSGGVPTPELVAAYSPGVWDMHSDAFQWYKGLYPAARAAGIQLTLYNNGVNLLSQPLLRTRTFFWAVFQQRLSGALCWWSVSDWKRSGSDFSGMFRADMGFNKTLLYGESGVLLLPPRRNGTNSIAPLDTLQWEQTLLGLQDYELLLALKRAVDQAPTSWFNKLSANRRQNEVMATAQKALGGVSKVIQGLSHVRPANDIAYTLDVRVLEQVRREVQDALAGLWDEAATLAN